MLLFSSQSGGRLDDLLGLVRTAQTCNKVFYFLMDAILFWIVTCDTWVVDTYIWIVCSTDFERYCSLENVSIYLGNSNKAKNSIRPSAVANKLISSVFSNKLLKFHLMSNVHMEYVLITVIWIEYIFFRISVAIDHGKCVWFNENRNHIPIFWQ